IQLIGEVARPGKVRGQTSGFAFSAAGRGIFGFRVTVVEDDILLTRRPLWTPPAADCDATLRRARRSRSGEKRPLTNASGRRLMPSNAGERSVPDCGSGLLRIQQNAAADVVNFRVIC